MEIRVHGRGGQGGVTCAKILAAVFARLGKSVQSFGDYAGERAGAPVRAYTRVSDRLITNRNKVYAPDHLLVLDPTLLGADVLAGLAAGGILAVNAPQGPEAFADRFGAFRIATVDATGIARRHRIGTRTVVIVNTTMAGAFVRLLDLPLALLEETYAHLGLESNLAAAREAFDAVRWLAPSGAAPAAPPPPKPPAEVVPLTAHLESPPSGLKTGSWRTQEPRYVEGLAPCHAFCPAGNDVVGFVRALATSGLAEAAAILARSTPLAAVCGHVCPAPCMDACNRRELDGAVNIRALERLVGTETTIARRNAPPARDPRYLAIVGGGPAGLSAAYAVARAGHRATIFDAGRRLGGVLDSGIPPFRLPRALVAREIGAVLKLGVGCQLGVRVGPERLATLAASHDAVIVATGLQAARRLSVRGSGLAGIESGLRYLERQGGGDGLRTGGHVVVLGGGNTAIDCARTALRAGAAKVTLAYRRAREEMPAIREEIEEAEAEGVRFLFHRQPAGFSGGGRVRAVELEEVLPGEPDATGRRRPVASGKVERLPCDAVLLALGQEADRALIPGSFMAQPDGSFALDGRGRLFLAGDLATGDGTVAHAIGNGRRAAGLALRALGVDVEVFARPDRARAVPATDIRLDHFARATPREVALRPPEERARDFAPVSRGLADAAEAERCFSCGHCTRCDTCLVYCPEGVVRRDAGGYEVDYSFCKGCGICAHECPRHALEMAPL